GWSHGDAEIFSLEQFIEWFDLKHISKSPAQFNPEKLMWLDQQYLKQSGDERLARLASPLLKARGCNLTSGPEVAAVVRLLKERAATVTELADAAVYFYQPVEPPAELKREHYTADIRPALNELMHAFEKIQWQRPAIHDALKAVVSQHGLKFPKIAMPLRVMVSGGTQTPSIDATLELIGKEEVLRRMQGQMSAYPA
ncbi:MAG TPA: glutamate--tRNA ligase, partial [Burkholderiales bacterium]|nr:glutamate--tRNA ligase [Burkholderiales bacterium]